MTFLEKLQKRTPTLSFEFYPPKNPDGWGTLYSDARELFRKKTAPDYVTVTYGAGGSTRQKTSRLSQLVFRMNSALRRWRTLPVSDIHATELGEILDLAYRWRVFAPSWPCAAIRRASCR